MTNTPHHRSIRRNAIRRWAERSLNSVVESGPAEREADAPQHACSQGENPSGPEAGMPIRKREVSLEIAL